MIINDIFLLVLVSKMSLHHLYLKLAIKENSINIRTRKHQTITQWVKYFK